MQEQIPEFEGLLRSRLPGFGGIWFDRAGAIVVAATRDSIDAARASTGDAPEDAVVRVLEVGYTYDELLGVHARIRNDRDALLAEGLNYHTLGIDIRTNSIEVSVEDRSTAIERLLVDRYGPMVKLVASPAPQPAGCTGRGNCADPLKGSLNVSIGGEICTSGFVSRAGTDYFLLSAGHCGSFGAAWVHNSIQYGTTRKTSFYDGSPADASAAKINANQLSNLVYRGSSTTFFAVIGNNNGLAVGSSVCLSARYMNTYDCGYVEDVYDDVCYEGLCFWDQTRVNSIDNPERGMSGGSFFTLASGANNIRAAGIMTAINAAGRIWYSKIDNVEWQLNLSTCKNSTCT